MTGCRPSELARLRAVDVADGVAVLSEHKTDKTGLSEQPVTWGRVLGALLVVAGLLCIKFL